MLGGVLASIISLAALFGMLKFKSDSFDKSMMYGLTLLVILMWLVPWGVLIIIPGLIVLSTLSPASREEWAKFRKRRIAIGIVFVLLLNSFSLFPVSEPVGSEEWGKPIATENPHASFWPASEQYTWFYDGAVISVVNVRTPHTFSPYSQDSSSVALGVMVGMHEDRMRQSIEQANSYIPSFSVDADAFTLSGVESEGGHSYSGSEYFISMFDVKRDGIEAALANVLVVGFPEVGGELSLLIITRPFTSSQEDVFEEKIVAQYIESR